MATGYITEFLTVLFFVTLVHSRAVPNSVEKEQMSPKDIGYAVGFLQRYGYIVRPDPRLGRAQTWGEVVQGIRQFQRIAGLNMSSDFNSETIKMMKKPRCGMPDFGPSDMMRRRKRFALHYSKWKRNDLTYRRMNSPTKTKLTEEEIDQVFRQAFHMWSEVSSITFKNIQEGVADIEIRFEAGFHNDGDSFDGPGGITAHAVFPFKNIGIHGDVHFDNDEQWVVGTEIESANLLWTAVHEIGHAIGLEHSQYHDAIMYPMDTGREVKLSTDDITGIQTHYGKPKPTVPTTVDAVMPTLDTSGPTACRTPIDAAFYDKEDGNTYFFKEQQFWILDKYNRTSGAKNLHDYWPELKSRVQAVYKRKDGMTVFFKGRRFWVYNGTKLIEKRKPIEEYGLPLKMKQIDAVFVWGVNGKTYFFKGHQYWRYNELHKSLDFGYPKNITSGWGNIEQPVDAVMEWKDSVSYFFKDLTFQKFDFMNKQSNLPSGSIAEHFMGCPAVKFLKSKGTRNVAVFLPGLILSIATVFGIL